MIDITFNVNNINTLNANGGVFIGQNALYGWTGHLKQNNDVASTVFIGDVSANVNILLDRDFLDSRFFHADTDITAGNFVTGNNGTIETEKSHRRQGHASSNRIEINGEVF